MIKRAFSLEKNIVHETKRILIFIFGATIILIGVALIFLPGPAFIVLFIGLSVLATEFLWARRLLKKAKDFEKRQIKRII